MPISTEPAATTVRDVTRRPATRVDALAVGAGTHVTLHPFGHVALVNVSETGALVEARVRPSVGTPVSLQLGPASTSSISGRVVRTRVSALHPDETMSYQLGVAFDRPTPVQLKPGVVSTAQGDAGAPELEVEREPARGRHRPVNQW